MAINSYKSIKYLIISILIIFVVSNAVLIGIDAFLTPDMDLIEEAEYGLPENSNGRFSIEMDRQSGYFKIKDNTNGVSYESYPAQIETDEEMREPSKKRIRSFMEVTLLDTAARTVTTVNTTQHSLENGGFSIEDIENGYLINYSFLGGEINIPVLIQVTDFGFSVIMNPQEITESKETNVLDVTILPFFISANTNAQVEGNLFIPDGSGALIDFQTKKPSSMSYMQKVYSSDLSILKDTDVLKSQGIRFPLFGSIQNSEIVMAVISKGAADAYIAANTDQERTTYINVCPRFALRERDKIIYDDNRSEVDIFQNTPVYLDEIRVDYYLESGEDLDYVDMAHMYREYLAERYNLLEISGQEQMPLFLEMYGATIKKRQYLGVPLDSVYSLTTYSQAEEILSSLKSSGVSDVILQYSNFSKETTWGDTIRRLSPLRQLGGKRDFNNLLDTVSEIGYQIYGSVNITEYYKGSSVFSNIYEPAKNMRKEPIQIFNFKPNTYGIDETSLGRYLIRNSRIVPFMSKYKDEVSSYKMGVGIKGHDNLYRDFSHDRATLDFTLDSVLSAVGQLDEKEIPIITNGGYDYELQFSDAIFNLPSSDSMFDLTDETIPFYHIVLHGLIPYSLEPINSSADMQYIFLKSLETGSSLQYVWTYESSDVVRYSRENTLIYAHYEEWFDEAIKMHNELNDVLAGTLQGKITGHEKIGENVYMTSFENNTKILVNYNNEEYISDSGIIEGRGYLVVGGGKG